MKIIHRFVVMLLAMAALLALIVPVQASEMDERIISSARQSYLFKTFLVNDNIKIESTDGVVTLTGVAADGFNKSVAEETVAGLPGVKSVDNRLEIKGETPALNSDAWIRNQVKYTLLFHRSVNARTTEVDVRDGVVTLRGDAVSQAQKELTTEYARDVEGVKDVNNKMIVAETAKDAPTTIGQAIDDASITAQVKLTLLFHRSTSAVNTKVETNNGDVTLYGKANNVAEKDLATKFANDINGVNSVKNRMTIK